jgi:hypothetical protein
MRPRRLDPEQKGRLAGLDAPPEPLLGREQKMLIERIGIDRDLDPFSTAGDDREHARP